MDDRLHINDLMDFYLPLLTEKQKNVCRNYYSDDLSLAEIAELEGISRAAVSDTLHTCRQQLQYYEDTMHCLSNMKMRLKLYSQLEKHTDEQGLRLLNKCKESEG